MQHFIELSLSHIALSEIQCFVYEIAQRKPGIGLCGAACACNNQLSKNSLWQFKNNFLIMILIVLADN